MTTSFEEHSTTDMSSFFSFHQRSLVQRGLQTWMRLLCEDHYYLWKRVAWLHSNLPLNKVSFFRGGEYLNPHEMCHSGHKQRELQSEILMQNHNWQNDSVAPSWNNTVYLSDMYAFMVRFCITWRSAKSFLRFVISCAFLTIFKRSSTSVDG